MNNSAISLKNELMTEDRPLVTFALFAFNQEKFIRAAVEAAFAQTYSPLEIILSDDCSGDDTFRIMQDLVRQYDGPHQVKLVQTPSNIGTFSHVMNSVRISEGQLLVLAAGDDISLPDRVGVLVSAWKRTEAWGLFSKFNRIDEFSQTQAIDCSLMMQKNALRSYFQKEPEIQLIHGATSAYDRRVFDLGAKFSDLKVLQEDAVFSFILNAKKLKIEFVNRSLVSYRSHGNSISNNKTEKDELGVDHILAKERRSAKYATSLYDLNTLLLRILKGSPSIDGSTSWINQTNISRDLRYYKMKTDWIDAGLFARLVFLFSSACTGRRGWLAPRLFGLRFFVSVKSMLRSLR
jgi:glycosyltransferase involved in cell wall biosynthesis